MQVSVHMESKQFDHLVLIQEPFESLIIQATQTLPGHTEQTAGALPAQGRTSVRPKEQLFKTSGTLAISLRIAVVNRKHKMVQIRIVTF